MSSGVLELISAVVAGGLVQAILFHLRSRRDSSRVDFSLIMSTIHGENLSLKEQNTELIRRVSSLEVTLNSLRAKIVMLESTNMVLPVPTWLKDTDGRMLAYNKAYEDAFLCCAGRNASEYIGKTDSEFWGEEIGDAYLINDQEVISGKVIWEGRESVLMPDQSIRQYRIIKFPRMLGDTVIGVGGMALPKEWHE